MLKMQIFDRRFQAESGRSNTTENPGRGKNSQGNSEKISKR